jgi:fumarate hydratase subunit alpha
MTEQNRIRVVELVAETLVRAGSTFSEDRKEAYRQAIRRESNEKSRWVLETILENAEVAEKNRGPLCDDTGIPHVFLEIGPTCRLTGELLSAIQEGVAAGLRQLPGRPMAIMGDDVQRLDQSGGLDPDSGALAAAPVHIRNIEEDVIRLHILMFGGGPAIRGRTYRVFHKHDVQNVLDQIVAWGTEAVKDLGCSPCTLAIGIGRSQYEAASLMLEAQVYGRYSDQTEMERQITDRVNQANIGALGLGGDVSVLGTFLRVGPQRASGVRIVSLRPCCCFEPRIASAEWRDTDDER